jgi:ankyrin repeat protein
MKHKVHPTHRSHSRQVAFVIVALLFCTAAPLLANLGESFTQISARYGRPLKQVPGSWLPGTVVYRFQFNERKIYVELANGKSVCEAIRAPENSPQFSEKTCLAMATALAATNNWVEVRRTQDAIYWKAGEFAAYLKTADSEPDYFTVATVDHAADAILFAADSQSTIKNMTPRPRSAAAPESRRPAIGGEICEAADKGDTEKVKALLKTNPALASASNSDGRTPLHYAVRSKNKGIITLLLESHADINAKDYLGQTPLHWAAGREDPEIAKLLLANKADVNSRDLGGATPLHDGFYTKVAAVLIAEHADISAVNDAGETALHNAAFFGRLDIVQLLVAHKADVNQRSLEGRTPLHEAAIRDQKDVAEFLLAHGADPTIKDKSGLTPLQVAVKYKSKDARAALSTNK